VRSKKEKCVRTIFKPFVLLLLVVLSGCWSYNYVWQEYPIESHRISPDVHFGEGKTVNVVKGKSNGADIYLGKSGPRRYYGSEQSLTDGIAEQLAIELRKKQVSVASTAEKSIEVAVVRSKFEDGTLFKAATIEVELKLGAGKTKTYTVQNRSPQTGPDTLNRVYNGAVARTVIEVLHDQEILSYINQ
jgi:hypothetical protein